jgi:RNA polymerase sigma-70 factor (ECF subfamily)
MAQFAEPLDGLGGVVAAAQRGDRSAFEQLYTASARLVHGVLLSRVPRTDVDDLVQDVFVTAMERLPTSRLDPTERGRLLN